MVLGICGKIASGKSEVLKILAARGFYSIDADEIVHDLYGSGGAGAKRVAAVFGEKFLTNDGGVDRENLRNAVFADDNKLKLLNDVIHPLVYEEIGELLKKSNKKNTAIEAVYFDPNFLDDFVDRLVWVERTKEKIIKTLVDERGFSLELAERAYDSIEMPLAAEIDFLVKNDGSLSDLEKAAGVLNKHG